MSNSQNIRRNLEAVLNCDGNCGTCMSLDFHSVTRGNAIFFAFGCKKADSLGAISERPSNMRQELIDALRFELDMA